jgi:hypothetical protein
MRQSQNADRTFEIFSVYEFDAAIQGWPLQNVSIWPRPDVAWIACSICLLALRQARLLRRLGAIDGKTTNLVLAGLRELFAN